MLIGACDPVLRPIHFLSCLQGELGFLMAQSSFTAGIMGPKTYVACIWALFVCTLVPPLIFGW